jgi:hypothetical protein
MHVFAQQGNGSYCTICLLLQRLSQQDMDSWKNIMAHESRNKISKMSNDFSSPKKYCLTLYAIPFIKTHAVLGLKGRKIIVLVSLSKNAEAHDKSADAL